MTRGRIRTNLLVSGALSLGRPELRRQLPDIDRKAHVKYLDRGDQGLAHGTDTYGTGMTVTPQICAASTVGFREMWFGADDRAQALRARVMPLFAEDPLRIPDFIGAGPGAHSDEAARGFFCPRLG